MKTKDLEIDYDLYTDILKFLVSGCDPSSLDALHLLKLEIAERLTQKVPQLRQPSNQEALLLAVEMKFTAIERAFASKHSQRSDSARSARIIRESAEFTLRSFGLFTEELKEENDIPF